MKPARFFFVEWHDALGTQDAGTSPEYQMVFSFPLAGDPISGLGPKNHVKYFEWPDLFARSTPPLAIS